MQVKEKKKAIILGVLLAVLALYWGNMLFGKGDGPAPAAGPAAPKKAAAQKPAAVKVNTDLLKQPRERYEAARNIFSPVYKKPELPKPKPLPGQPGGGPAQAMQPPLPPLPPPPPPKSPQEIAAENAREELRKIKVLGFLKRKGRTDVFLSLNNTNYIVGKGENITKQYFLDQVGKDSIMVSDKETGIQVTVAADFSGKAASKTQPSPGVGKAQPGLPAPPPAPYGQSGRPVYGGTGRSISVQGGGAPGYVPGGGAAVTRTAPPAPPPPPVEPFPEVHEGLGSNSI